MALVEGRVTVLYPGDQRELYKLPEIETVQISESILDLMKNWENKNVIDDYLSRHRDVDRTVLQDILQSKPMFLQVAGIDFVYVKNMKTGVKEFLTIETNSCPAGFLSTPSYTRPYESLLLSSFFREEKFRMSKSEGALAFLLGDTLELDSLSFPHFMAEISQEKVYVLSWASVQNENGQVEKYVKFMDGIMYVKDDTIWVPIRACFRWLRNVPWLRLPVKNMKTFIYPHPITCLTTGKNKILADVAYKRFNEEYSKHGLEIRTPKTLIGIEKKNMHEIIRKEFGGRAIIKTPYDSVGRGIYVIRSESDVNAFLETDNSRYNLFVVQDLIGLESDASEIDEFIQVGFDDTDGYKYACTFRADVSDGPTRFIPIVLRGTRAPIPFSHNYNGIPCVDSMYITNMGRADTKRYIPVDVDGMKRMGITDADIVDVYVQSVMCMIAIDNICKELMTEDGSLDFKLLEKLCPEEQLIREVEIGIKSEILQI